MNPLRDRIRQHQIIIMLLELQEKIDALWAVATEGTQWSDNFIRAQEKVQEELDNDRKKFES